MKLEIKIYHTYKPCAEKRLTVDIPKLNMNFWICMDLSVKFWFIKGHWMIAVNFK